MKSIELNLSEKPVELKLISAGDLFFWDNHICFKESRRKQYLLGPGEVLKLQPDTSVHVIIITNFKVDSVRHWVRVGLHSDKQAQKTITPIERLILTKEMK